MSHSQYGEDRIILSFLKGRQGTFLDIGANDGRTFSNTHDLALLGWSGLCVDASPRAYASLVQTYKDRPDIITVHAAITDKDGPVQLQEASDTLVSSLDPHQPQAWVSCGFDWQTVHVPGMTFATLMAQVDHHQFEMVSIDAEGHDLIILEQMDLEALGCDLLCIEHGGRYDKIKALCPGMKEMYRNGVNMIMVR